MKATRAEAGLSPPEDTISFRASDMNIDSIAVGEKIRATYDGQSFGLLLIGRRRDRRKGGNGTLRCVGVKGNLVTMAWKPDPPKEEPRGTRRERRAAKSKARRAR